MSADKLRSEITSWLEAQGYRVWPCDFGGLLSQARVPELGAAHLQRPGPIIRILISPKGVDADAAAHLRELRAKGTFVIGAARLEDVQEALAASLAASEGQGEPSSVRGVP